MMGMERIASLLAFAGRKVTVKYTLWATGAEAETTAEFRGVWRDSVPYYPDIPTPAVWLTDWSEFFIPVANIESIETVSA